MYLNVKIHEFVKGMSHEELVEFLQEIDREMSYRKGVNLTVVKRPESQFAESQFAEHLERASETVRAWPPWKQGVARAVFRNKIGPGED